MTMSTFILIVGYSVSFPLVHMEFYPFFFCSGRKKMDLIEKKFN